MARYLIDTHIFLWSLHNPDKLSPKALSVLENQENIIFVSAAVTWEILIKCAKGSLTFTGDIVESIHNQSFLPLAITHQHVMASQHLPLIHQDPFDRITIAQAIADDLTLITRDKKILKYKNVKFLKG